MRKIASSLALVALAAVSVCARAKAQTTAPANIYKLRIVLVGDSTVTPGAGWGNGLQSHLAPEVEVINLSMGGRSSKSFRDEGRWEPALALKPDYILIQFGHNDQPGKGPERETDAKTTFPENMRRYATDAKAAGIKPILVTSLVRRNFKGDTITSNLVDYVEATKKAAAETGTPLLDLHQLSLDKCNAIGQAECERLSPKSAEGKVDTTHLKSTFSTIIGQLVASELGKLEPTIAPFVLKEPFGVSVTNSAELQAAITNAPENLTRPYIIRLAPGAYSGHFLIPKTKPFITLRGDRADTTIITDDKSINFVKPDGVKVTTPESATVLVEGTDFAADNITFANTAGQRAGQALAMYQNADRSVFRDCRFLGWQDTLRPNKGRSYFADCYIEGHVDFIYAGGIAWFDRCHIHALASGYITAASTPETQPFGYVLSYCKVTAADGVKTFLGRPWRPFAAVTFLNCELTDAIRPEGWDNWGKESNEKTARYAEYKSTGPGANPTTRVGWAKQLTDEEAKAINLSKVLSGEDKWRVW